MTRVSKRPRVIGSVRANRGRWRASYKRHNQTHTPGRTFTTEEAAWAWLTAEQVLIDSDAWTPPSARRAAATAERETNELTLDAYARNWIDKRTTRTGRPLADKTKYEYRRYLDGRLESLAAHPLVQVTRADVDQWWEDNDDVPTLRHHAYAFLSSVIASALDRGIIHVDPCRVEHASARNTKRPKHEVDELIMSLSHLEVATLADAMPAQHRALVLLLAYSGIRPGEALALTRTDFHASATTEGVPRWFVKVTKAVNQGKSGPPKTAESIRTVPLPPHIVPAIEEHLSRHAAPTEDGLVFQSSHAGQKFATLGQIAGSTGKGKGGKVTGFNAARAAIARPTLRLYDLRRWARYTWRQADISEYECERLLGHKLGVVTGAYFTFDLDAFWPNMERISQAAGWRPPHTPVPSEPDPGALAKVLAALDDQTLATTLAALDATQIAQLAPQLPPQRIAAVVATMTNRKPTLRIVKRDA